MPREQPRVARKERYVLVRNVSRAMRRVGLQTDSLGSARWRLALCVVQLVGVHLRSPVPVQMWEGQAQSRCRCGRDGPSPGADVGGMGPVPVQM